MNSGPERNPFARAAEGGGSEALPFIAVCGLAHLLERPGVMPPPRRGFPAPAGGGEESCSASILPGDWPTRRHPRFLFQGSGGRGRLGCSGCVHSRDPLLPAQSPPPPNFAATFLNSQQQKKQLCRVQNGNDKIGKSRKGPSRSSSSPPHPPAVQGSKLPPADPASLNPALWASLFAAFGFN